MLLILNKIVYVYIYIWIYVNECRYSKFVCASVSERAYGKPNAKLFDI